MTELQRLTTQYDAAEDRIRLSGSTPLNETLTLWLTQRLLNRLVPLLCQGLEKQVLGQPGEQALRVQLQQSFAQQRALAALPRQAPVQPGADSPQWRVEVVDVKQAPGGVRLVFKGAAEAQQAVLKLPTPAMRQWLGIVFEQYRRAGWATQVWPAWMEEAAAPLSIRTPAGLVH